MSKNPYLIRAAASLVQSPGYHRSKGQEKAVAKRAGGWRVPGSGSGSKKGDVQVKSIARIECKTTQNKSFSVTREMVEKILHAGLGADEMPAIVIEFLGETGKPELEVAVIDVQTLMELINARRPS